MKYAGILALLEEGNYDDAFRKCSSLRKNSARVSEEVLYLGACSLFALGHIRQSQEWVEDFGRATNEGAQYQYLLAYLLLHAGRTDEALLCWTKILQLDPSETFADKLIERLRIGESAVLKEIQDPIRFRKYVPFEWKEDASKPSSKSELALRMRRFFSLGLAGISGKVILLVLLVSALLFGTSYYLYQTDFSALSIFDDDLPDVPSTGSVIDPSRMEGDKPRFIYETKNDVRQEFASAREKIKDGYVNQARFLLGKIELSNATFEIKERALLLRDAIPMQSRSSFQDIVSIRDVEKEPYLYRGAQVLWRAKILEITSGTISYKPDEAVDTTLITRKIDTPRKVGETVEIFGRFAELRDGQLLVELDSLD